jgi:hypothetical protein
LRKRRRPDETGIVSECSFPDPDRLASRGKRVLVDVVANRVEPDSIGICICNAPAEDDGFRIEEIDRTQNPDCELESRLIQNPACRKIA